MIERYTDNSWSRVSALLTERLCPPEGRAELSAKSSFWIAYNVIRAYTIVGIQIVHMEAYTWENRTMYQIEDKSRKV